MPHHLGKWNSCNGDGFINPGKIIGLKSKSLTSMWLFCTSLHLPLILSSSPFQRNFPESAYWQLVIDSIPVPVYCRVLSKIQGVRWGKLNHMKWCVPKPQVRASHLQALEPMGRHHELLPWVSSLPLNPWLEYQSPKYSRNFESSVNCFISSFIPRSQMCGPD